MVEVMGEDWGWEDLLVDTEEAQEATEPRPNIMTIMILQAIAEGA